MGIKGKISLAFILGFVLLFQTGTFGNDYTVSAQTEVTIPEWIKETAKFWADGSVDDTTFVNSFEWLFKNGIIETSELTLVDSESDDISGRTITVPPWVKNNAKFWTDGEIGDSDFANGITFLYKEGIVTSPTVRPNPCPEFEPEESIFDLLFVQNILGLTIPNFMAFADEDPCIKLEQDAKNYDLRIIHFGASEFQIKPGDSFYYDLIIFNNGNVEAESVKLNLDLDDEVNVDGSVIGKIEQEKHQSWFDPASTKTTVKSDCSHNNFLSKINCNLGNIASGDAITMKIPVTTNPDAIDEFNEIQKKFVDPKHVNTIELFNEAEIIWQLPTMVKFSFLSDHKTTLSYPIMKEPCDEVTFDEPSLQLDFILPSAYGENAPCPSDALKVIDLKAELIKNPIIGKDPKVEFSFKLQFDNGTMAKNHSVDYHIGISVNGEIISARRGDAIANNIGEVLVSVIARPGLGYHINPNPTTLPNTEWKILSEDSDASVGVEDIVIKNKSITYEESSSIRQIGIIWAEYEITWFGHPYTKNNFPKAYDDFFLRVLEPSHGVDSSRSIPGWDRVGDGGEDFLIHNALSGKSYDVELHPSRWGITAVPNSQLTIDTTPCKEEFNPGQLPVNDFILFGQAFGEDEDPCSDFGLKFDASELEELSKTSVRPGDGGIFIISFNYIGKQIVEETINMEYLAPDGFNISEFSNHPSLLNCKLVDNKKITCETFDKLINSNLYLRILYQIADKENIPSSPLEHFLKLKGYNPTLGNYVGTFSKDIITIQGPTIDEFEVEPEVIPEFEGEPDAIKVIEKGVTLNKNYNGIIAGDITGFFQVVAIRDDFEYPYGGKTISVIRVVGPQLPPGNSYGSIAGPVYTGTTDVQGVLSFEEKDVISGRTHHYWLENPVTVDHRHRIDGSLITEVLPARTVVVTSSSGSYDDDSRLYHFTFNLQYENGESFSPGMRTAVSLSFLNESPWGNDYWTNGDGNLVDNYNGFSLPPPPVLISLNSIGEGTGCGEYGECVNYVPNEDSTITINTP